MNSLHNGACAPVTTERACATRPDNRPISTESVDALRTIERWVDTRWYRSTSSSTSAPVNRRRRLTSCSNRSHVGRCASTNASTSTWQILVAWAVMVRQQEPVVTGDAVVLDVQIAQLPVRALSALIDIIVVLIAYIIGVLLWAVTLTQFDPALSAAVLIIFTIVTIVGYPVAFETATRGRSLGKMALGLRVVSDDGSPERFRQALFRALAGVIEIWTFFGRPSSDLQPALAKGQAHRRRVRRHGSDQRACATAQPAATDAAAAGVVGILAATVRARGGAGRVGPSISLPRSAIGSCGAGSDGLPDRRRRRRTDITTSTAGRAAATGPRGGARRTAST